MNDVKTGDRVHVEFDGTVAEFAKVIDDKGVPHDISFYSNPDVVTKLDPADWPPKAGDVWTADGEAYGVRDHTFMPGIVVSTVRHAGGNYSDSYGTAREKLTAFKALNPTLLYRKDAE